MARPISMGRWVIGKSDREGRSRRTIQVSDGWKSLAV